MPSGGVLNDHEREKHRIAEEKRRKNPSQLLQKLDSHVHDIFLEQAGWNSHRSTPQSKEQIIQGAIHLMAIRDGIHPMLLLNPCQKSYR
jgi:hypothetical protein